MLYPALIFSEDSSANGHHVILAVTVVCQVAWQGFVVGHDGSFVVQQHHPEVALISLINLHKAQDITQIAISIFGAINVTMLGGHE